MPRLKAKLIAVNVPSNNSDASQSFYQMLLGIDFARSFTEAKHSVHAPLAEQGLWMWVTSRNAPDEGIAPVFAVDDLQQSTTALEGAGGQRIVGPVDAPISPRLQQTYDQLRHGQHTTNSMGKFTLMRDPDGSYFWIGQLEEHCHEWFGYGKFDRGLSQGKLDAHQRTKRTGSVLP